jgi:hypothetical protein
LLLLVFDVFYNAGVVDLNVVMRQIQSL